MTADTELELTPTCRFCGCTDDCACEGGCYWIDSDLCSRCVDCYLEVPALSVWEGYGLAAEAVFRPEELPSRIPIADVCAMLGDLPEYPEDRPSGGW